jgi:hypothetical protein
MHDLSSGSHLRLQFAQQQILPHRVWDTNSSQIPRLSAHSDPEELPIRFRPLLGLKISPPPNSSIRNTGLLISTRSTRKSTKEAAFPQSARRATRRKNFFFSLDTTRRTDPIRTGIQERNGGEAERCLPFIRAWRRTQEDGGCRWVTRVCDRQVPWRGLGVVRGRECWATGTRARCWKPSGMGWSPTTFWIGQKKR